MVLNAIILGVEVELTSIKHGPKDLRNECEIAIGTFKIGYLNIQLINARVNSFETKLQDLSANEDVTLVLGEIPAEDSGNSFKLCFITFLNLLFFLRFLT